MATVSNPFLTVGGTPNKAVLCVILASTSKTISVPPRHSAPASICLVTVPTVQMDTHSLALTVTKPYSSVWATMPLRSVRTVIQDIICRSWRIVAKLIHQIVYKWTPLAAVCSAVPQAIMSMGSVYSKSTIVWSMEMQAGVLAVPMGILSMRGAAVSCHPIV